MARHATIRSACLVLFSRGGDQGCEYDCYCTDMYCSQANIERSGQFEPLLAPRVGHRKRLSPFSRRSRDKCGQHDVLATNNITVTYIFLKPGFFDGRPGNRRDVIHLNWDSSKANRLDRHRGVWPFMRLQLPASAEKPVEGKFHRSVCHGRGFGS